MFDLLLHIIFASSFTLFIKWAQVRGSENVIIIGAINYIVAALVILPVFLISNPTPVSSGALWSGGSMGGIYFIAFFFAIFSIQKVGASSTTVVSVLSILLPIGFAAIYWSDQPNLIQSIGIALALFSLTLIGAHTNRASEEGQARPKWIVPTVLFVFFLLCGFSRMAQEAFKHVSQPEQRPAFILAAFSIAAIPSLCWLVYRRKIPMRMEIVIGTLMGLANIFQTHFILRALEHLVGFIVFPVASAGSIVLTALVAVGLLGEQLNRRTYVGIVISVVALFLLYWVPGA
jgi:drug/metabolite transporter (DMT)-like permease